MFLFDYRWVQFWHFIQFFFFCKIYYAFFFLCLIRWWLEFSKFKLFLVMNSFFILWFFFYCSSLILGLFLWINYMPVLFSHQHVSKIVVILCFFFYSFVSVSFYGGGWQLNCKKMKEKERLVGGLLNWSFNKSWSVIWLTISKLKAAT